MKNFICILVALYLATQSFASVSESELTTIKRYLGPSLMKIFNTTEINVQQIEKFLEKNEFMGKYLAKFANNKKKAIKDMPASFFHGLLYAHVEQLEAYEKLSAEAFINNNKYHKNITYFRQNFPAAQCYSANYTITLMDLQRVMDWDSFDPMILYFGIMSIVNNIDGNTPEQQAQVEMGLKNMTDGLNLLEQSINNAVSSGSYDANCVSEVINVIENFKKIFVTVEELKKAFDAFQHKVGGNVAEKLSKIVKDIDHYYFNSMTTSNIAFRMTAMELGETLMKMSK